MYEYKVSKVVKVVDGDTVDVILDLGFGLFKKERVRLAGIDTPEKRTRDLREKKLGYDATHYAEDWFSNASGEYVDDIIVTTSKDGKYGRMLGKFYRRKKEFPQASYCLNEQIVEDGYAFEYWGETKRDMSEMDTLMVLLSKRGYDSWENYTEANQ